jgi:hypothetical protein
MKYFSFEIRRHLFKNIRSIREHKIFYSGRDSGQLYSPLLSVDFQLLKTKGFEKLFHKKELTLDTIEMKIYKNLIFKEKILRLFQIEK